MICSITSTALMLHCSRCRKWVAADVFEEHSFGHHVRGELPYSIDRVACRIYLMPLGTRGERVHDLWEMKREVDDDCAAMKLRNSLRFNESLRLATEAARQQVREIEEFVSQHK